MRQDQRAPFEQALRRAREAARAPGEGFMTEAEIRRLAARAGAGPGVAVLDVGCGVGGPGRLLDCDYLGLDFSESAIAIAREHANGHRYEVAQVPPLPAGPFDVVLMLETMLAVEDKDALVHGVAAALRPGGRFAFTLEEGPPLTSSERATMPDADTVWLARLEVMTGFLEQAGLEIAWIEDQSRAHRATAQALAEAYAADAEEIAARLGARALEDLLAAHRLWIDWLDAGRVRKLAVIATA